MRQLKMIIRYRIVIIGMLCVIVGSILGVQQTSANSPIGLSVSPPTIEMTANPGERLQNSIRVENITSQPLPISVDVKNFSALGEDGQVNLGGESSTHSLLNWVQLSQEKLVLKPRQVQTIEFELTIPKNAEPGGKYGSIVFSTTPRVTDKNTNIAVGQEVGSLLFLKVAGEVDESASIDSFKPDSNIYNNGPINFIARVRNSGNIQVKPEGTITIVNLFGSSVASVPIDSNTILPGSVRKLKSTWRPANGYGPYIATVSMTYGDKRKPLTSSTMVWIVPYRTLVPAIVVFSVAVPFIYKGRHRLMRAAKILFGKG